MDKTVSPSFFYDFNVLDNLSAFIYSGLSPYFYLFKLILYSLSSVVKLSPVFIMKLFFLYISGPYFNALSAKTLFKYTCKPINSANDYYPNNLYVCKFI
jgi:hypothetical protein